MTEELNSPVSSNKYIVTEDEWKPMEKAVRESLNAEEEVKRLNKRLERIEHIAWSLIRSSNRRDEGFKDWVEAMRLTLINK